MAIGDAWAEGSFADSSFAVGAWLSSGAPTLAYTSQPIATPTSISVTTTFTATGTNPIEYAVVVVTDGSAAPDPDDMLAGTPVTGQVAAIDSQAAANGVEEISNFLSGLSASTAYDLYVAIDDSVSSAILSNKVDFTTTAPGTVSNNLIPLSISLAIGI